ncbi:MAG: SWIM zinc finger family protein [Haloarculaceae archaeon]
MTDIEHSATDRKTALAPDLRAMSDRAARAWAERMAVRPLPGGTYAVESGSGATYVVDPEAGSCTCPDSQFRGATCKHRRRVAIEVTTGRVPPPGRRRGTCIACGEEAFVPEEGPALCPACEFEPGDVVRDRETGDRVVVERVRAEPADEVPVPDSGPTVADYPTNEGYPADDPVVEAVYLRRWRDEDARVYRFPHSRLAATGAAMLE